MADAQALGYGCALGVDTAGGASYTDIAAIRDQDWSASRDSVDATNQDSPGMTREKRPGLIDNGQITFDAHLYYDNASQQNLIRTLFERDVTVSQVIGTFRLTFWTSDGGTETVTFSGFPTSRDLTLPIEDMQAVSVTIEINGAVTWS